MNIRILSAGSTDIGPRKKVNEDSYFLAFNAAAESPVGIFAVADGVSGSSHGEIASSACVRAVELWWKEKPAMLGYETNRVIPSLIETILDTDRKLRHMQPAEMGRSSSTLSVLLIIGNGWFTFNTGDSRVYRLKKGLFSRLEQITEDQSCLVEREYKGQKYFKSVLTSCVGGKNAFQYSYSHGTLSQGERFLVCSDGVYKTLSERRMKGILKSKNLTAKEICDRLIDSALQNGETDNITAISVLC